MIIDWNNINIIIKPGKTDFRKQINGLAIIIESELQMNVFSNTLFVFCSNDRKKIKILYWDKNGFCIWQKRLELDKFPWPKNTIEARSISIEEFRMLLTGIDFFAPHKTLNYTSII